MGRRHGNRYSPGTHNQTAEKIAEASRLLGAVPLTQIAREIGVSRGTLYTDLPAIKTATKSAAKRAAKIAVGG